MTSQKCLAFLALTTSYLIVTSYGQYGHHICQSSGYRNLPTAVQNEHQCMVLERLQMNMRGDKMERNNHFAQIVTRIAKLDSKIARGLGRLTRKTTSKGRDFPALSDIPVARDCNELQMAGISPSGVYPIRLQNGLVVNVLCDFDTHGGGWTVVQRREGGVVNFTRKWNDYTFGFGNVNTEYWLGNENLHLLTSSANYSLRVDLWDWEDNYAYALYDYFRVDSEQQHFRLHVKGYRNSSAGDSLKHHDGMMFTTMDRDNDRWWANCARKDRSGWWFNKCSYCSLNGVFHQGGQQQITPDGTSTGITWFEWTRRPGYSLKRVEMKLKPRLAVIKFREMNVTDPIFN